MTPTGRGFESSLGYLGGGEDHYTQISKEFCGELVDLWKANETSAGPAHGYNGTYAAFTYANEGVRLVKEFKATAKAEERFFLYMALQDMHAPQQVPAAYSDLYPAPHYTSDYAIENGMASLADEVLRNVTNGLKSAGMWPNTFFVYTSDNGGPSGFLASGHSANNWPLRGGKTNFFEGGIRVTAFVSGGFIPTHVRGQKRSGYIHISDWYPTSIGLAGGDPTDDHPGLPSVDGIDMWGYLNGSVSESPRYEIMIGSELVSMKPKAHPTFPLWWNGALINGSYKLILGAQSYGFHTGPNYPNATTNHSAEEVDGSCGATGCLFDIQHDPFEYNNLAKEMPEKLAAMFLLFQQRNATRFEAPKATCFTQGKPQCAKDIKACTAASVAYGNFYGPFN
jgi:arylsulfatase I/J